jgi:RNA polymerase sigma factor (sigma-70 family)
MFGRSLIVPAIHPEQQLDSKTIRLSPKHLDDVSLWNSFLGGDDAALITIFDLHVNALYNYGCKIYPDRETVKDAVQDLFAELHQTRSRLNETNAIRFYLFKCLRRKLLRLKTKIESIRNIIFPAEKIEPSCEFFLITEQATQEQRDKVSAMVNTLSKRQHEAIFLRYYEDLPYDKIAEIMGINRQAVYNLIHQAIQELRAAFS